MISKIRIENFRGFDIHSLELKPTTIIVGRNNAGKSSIVEALRIISVITERYENLEFHSVPDWLELSKKKRGVSPSLKGLDINFQSIFYSYNKPPAKINVEFTSGHKIDIYLGSGERIHAVLYDQNHGLIDNRRKAIETNFPLVGILPQIGPLQREEKRLTYSYLRGKISSSLFSSHFRNHILVFDECYKKFKDLVESTWPGIQIKSINVEGNYPDQTVTLLVRDESFVAEIAWMGHGLQMWLQIMWFLSYVNNYNCVILDEPDVYMHADLQRGLIRLMKNRFRQIILTTHSVEIMSEVEPDDILIIDKNTKQSKFAGKIAGVQSLINNLGGVHNIQLARLWSSKKCLLIEGEDIDYLKRFQSILFPNSKIPLDTIPNLPVGGWGGWNYAIGSGLFINNAVGDDILIYCILDRDYHCIDEIEQRMKMAKAKGIQLHVWSYKEIENYFLIPNAIFKAINSAINNIDGIRPTLDEVISLINALADEYKQEITDNIASDYQQWKKRPDAKAANFYARQIVESGWKTFPGKISLLPGKIVLSRIAKWSQEQYGVSLSYRSIASNIEIRDLGDEVKEVLRCIEFLEPFENH